MSYITASKLYNHCKCPHKIHNDAFADPDLKDQASEFMKLLWEKGVEHEEVILKGLPDYTDISKGNFKERKEKTIQALQRGDSIIYQGVIESGSLQGIPDLIMRDKGGKYYPIDIKSGRGLDGGDDIIPGVLREHYAMQLAVYVDILMQLGYCDSKMGYIYDIDTDRVKYSLETPINIKTRETYWDRYQKRKKQVIDILENNAETTPALGGMCKQCAWYSMCKKEVFDKDDLTKIFYMGRRDRDTINKDLKINTVKELAELDISKVMAIKNAQKSFKTDNFLPRIGEKMITDYVRRANVYQKNELLIRKEINFPKKKYELFFDIEDDPMQDFIYLHGVVQRVGNREEYFSFTADTIEEERQAWSNFLDYIKSLPEDDFVMYYYSKHEETAYKRLMAKYPGVVMPYYLEELFKKSVDLYSVVYNNTDWPLHSYSIKSIARFLGFDWRDKNPSGAESIEWFSQYQKTKDSNILRRILEYNEDDCRATLVLKDKLS